MITCKNCQTEFEGKFCPNCSQKATTKRFTIGHFAHEVFHAVTHTDKGILFLIKELFRRPGHVALEYNEGKRKKYFNPITYLLLVLAIQLFAVEKTGIFDYFIDTTQQFVESVQKASPEAQLDDSIKKLKEAKVLQKKILEYNKILTFIFIPFLAFLSWLFFYKSGHNFAENVVLAIMTQAQLYLIFLLMCVALFLVVPISVMVTYYLYLIIMIVYNLIAYRQFFKQKKRWIIIKGITVQILYFVVINEISKIVVQYL